MVFNTFLRSALKRKEAHGYFGALPLVRAGLDSELPAGSTGSSCVCKGPCRDCPHSDNKRYPLLRPPNYLMFYISLKVRVFFNGLLNDSFPSTFQL